MNRLKLNKNFKYAITSFYRWCHNSHAVNKIKYFMRDSVTHIYYNEMQISKDFMILKHKP